MYHLSLQPDFRPSVFVGKFHFISLKNLLFSRLELFTHHRKCCFEWLLSDYLILLWIQTDYICLLWMTTVFSIAGNTEIADVWKTQPVPLKLKDLWGWERRCFFYQDFIPRTRTVSKTILIPLHYLHTLIKIWTFTWNFAYEITLLQWVWTHIYSYPSITSKRTNQVHLLLQSLE